MDHGSKCLIQVDTSQYIKNNIVVIVLKFNFRVDHDKAKITN